MIDQELLKILVCPQTRQPLREASAELLARVNARITSGALTMPEKIVRPRKRRYFTSVNAASVPSATEPQAV